MAEDLKQTMTKVLTSKGGKRFHFGYATGKTTDGKAEGFLMVGKKKFKKDQAEKECETKDFFAGFCWSDEEGKTVYFAAKGKKLSKMIVTKMILSVKHQTGRRYEFELPSEEAEAKADALAEEAEGQEGEGEQEVQGAPPAPPPPGGTPPPPPPTTGKADPAARSYEALRAGMVDPVARLRTTDATTADKIQRVMDGAAVFAGKGDYAKALTALKEAAKALATAAPSAGATRANETAVPTGTVAVAVLRQEIQTVRTQAVQGLGKLEDAVRKTAIEDAGELAGIVQQLSKNMPAEMEVILEQLDAAVKAQNADGVKKLKGDAQKAAKGWLEFLAANASQIEGCEQNPWNIPVRIAEPVRNSLKAIVNVTK